MVIINLDDSNVWIKACEQHTILFWYVKAMAMEKLVIAQHHLFTVWQINNENYVEFIHS
jgi:hypothetical protein